MTFESVEYDDEDEATAPEPATASAVAPMTNERLAELEGIIHSRLKRMPIFVTREGRELVAEVKRQRFEIARANQEIETLSAEVAAEHGEAEEARADGAQWQSRAETAERELAELRERIVAQVADHLRQRAHDAALADVDGYSCEAAATWMAAAELVEGGKWKAADGG